MVKLKSHCVAKRRFASSRAYHMVVESPLSTNKMSFAPLNPSICKE